MAFRLSRRAMLRGMGSVAIGLPILDAMLAQGQQLDYCLAKQTFRFAMGHRETADDDALIQRVLDRFRGKQAKFSELIVGVVTDDSFFFRRED